MADQGRRWRAWRQPGAWSLTGYPAPGRVGHRTHAGRSRSVVWSTTRPRSAPWCAPSCGSPGPAVVEGEGADGADAVDLARRLQPDAMLLDVSMPGHGRSDRAARRCCECSPGTRVVMFSGFDEEPLALRALELGRDVVPHQDLLARRRRGGAGGRC